MSKVSYRDSGVDVEAGDQLVDWLVASESAPGEGVTSHGKGRGKGPRADQVVSGIGGFAAVFRAQFQHLKKPCLVASTDGIGTKILLAAHAKRYREVAQDLVAMCVNDLVCSGAEPLFFLDYYATSKLEPAAAKEFLSGVRDACASVNCALIGGETAEMPGVYKPGDFDAAGFSVGVVDEENMLGPARVAIGDQVIGVSSSGFHSNGFSLLRRLFENDLDEWMERLLEPTALYVNLVLGLHKAGKIKAVAHITGGGMENLPRVLPAGTEVKLVDWAWPEEFIEVQERASLSREEMLKTLNCGVGLAIVCAPENVAEVETAIQESGRRAMPLGRIDRAADPGAEARVVY
ncbi:MAG: phosphoribosylformylglycinamidine cyclo-ligase [Bdellovibrionales bacterium]|jgi:phosphoribosylformylglycinamidine cyclo-ligase|nr:phosphoribosylformylglycinamidine cyclo-ligase [Bdellovibrionales bacterium]